jgi:DNA-directed RNA polymerase specialized sigma24 family protein
MADQFNRNSPAGVALSVLDVDPGRAEIRYGDLRRDLIRYLEWSGCRHSEDVADEALYRGLKRLGEGVDTSQASPRAFIFGVAKLVAKEYVKRHMREAPLDPAVWDYPSTTSDHAGVDARLMLERTLNQLAPRDRSIILRYCTEDDHGPQSRELGVSSGNLRLIVHRIRNGIRDRARSRRSPQPASAVGSRGRPIGG